MVKNGDQVWVLQHLHNLPLDCEGCKLIGLYRSERDAREAIERLAGQEGFRDSPEIVDPLTYEGPGMPDGFYLDAWTVGDIAWEEGFFTYTYPLTDEEANAPRTFDGPRAES